MQSDDVDKDNEGGEKRQPVDAVQWGGIKGNTLITNSIQVNYYNNM